MREDQEHLRVLAICHYVMGGLSFLCGFFPLIYVFLGLMFVNLAQNAPNNGPGPPPPEEVGWIFVIFGSAGAAIIWILAIMELIAGRKLQTYSGRIFCIVLAVIECTNPPLGTILGVFTLIILLRPSVKELFERGGPSALVRYDDRRYPDYDDDEPRRRPYRDRDDDRGSENIELRD